MNTNDGTAVFANDLSTSNGCAVKGTSVKGYGVIGSSLEKVGVWGISLSIDTGNNVGVRGDGLTYDFLGGGGEYGAGGNWYANNFDSRSDRNAKENFTQIDYSAILAKINQLPISQWNLKQDKKKVKHVGPVSQDFYALFGLGEDDKHIALNDASGVALAGIKALNQKIEAQGAEIKALRERIKGLEEKMQAKP
jgi:hypothetical protein